MNTRPKQQHHLSPGHRANENHTPNRYGDLWFASSTGNWRFTEPEHCIVCDNADTLEAALAAIEAALDRGRYVAGFLSYEAGVLLSGCQPTRLMKSLPLLWFGVYRSRHAAAPIEASQQTVTPPIWEPGISYTDYQEHLKRIRHYIEAGDTYQVNYTFPLLCRFDDDPWAWFQFLYTAQPTDHAAFLDLGRHCILSLSPELFFQVAGNTLITRPMKGTAPRGLYPEADQQARERLRHSDKDRAENVMIVDLLRNDMGRISETGTVCVEQLFEVERYATVWQMTSTITAMSNAPFGKTMKALSPCGSVTGAPKIRTMHLIDEIESCPRGVYCGAIGWWGPARQAEFNVAIRTITLDRAEHIAQYPVGGGITWDSQVRGEYEECLSKAAILTQPQPSFELLESLRYEGDYFLLELHLDRICSSADYFDFQVSRQQLRDTLLAAAQPLAPGVWKVRLRVNRHGKAHVDIEKAPPPRPFRVVIADTPISSDSVFLYHKTTARQPYEQARAVYPEADDVLLWNERGEVTESTLANIVAHVHGAWITPPVSCGLLGGVMRAELLRKGIVEERAFTVETLYRANHVYLVNSVRKWIPILLETASDRPPPVAPKEG